MTAEQTDREYRFVLGAVVALTAAVALAAGNAVAQGALVPRPQKATWGEGAYVVRSPRIDRSVATFETDATLPREGYRLSVTSAGVRIRSSSAAGAFYAVETLRQLARPGEEKGTFRIPFVEIEDAPKYRWRGLLLDEGRHFFGKAAVKRVLDLMAQHKMNVFHWHLTEDAGWRLDVPGLPELARYGSVRAASPAYGEVGTEDKNGWHGRLVRETYGPFCYTETDVREIVAYAAERNIDVLPEIDLPGHVCAFLAAYPQFACRPENFAARTPRAEWGIAKDVLCVGNPEAIACFDRIFDYVTDVFPFPFVHIGGDECPRERWKTCPKCQAFMKANGMRDEDELQRWVQRHVAARLAGKGRRMIGWDECFDGPVPENMVGMFRYIDGPPKGWTFAACREVAGTGRDVIAAPWQCCYHDYAQGVQDDPFVYISSRPCTLEDAYFDIAATVPAEQAQHLLGSESCCWGEYTWYQPDLEWKTWPRSCATAEVLWSGRGDFEDFYARMETHRKRLVAQGVNCAPLTRRGHEVRKAVTVKRLETEMRAKGPTFRRFGAISPQGEASPFVFRGKLYRMELSDPTFGLDFSDPRICCEIRERDTGRVVSRFANRCYYASVFQDGGKVYVTATRLEPQADGKYERSGTIMLFETEDLVNWKSRVLFSRPGWRFYNTSMTKGPDGYVLAFESDHQPEAGRPFTVFFAKSKNMVEWDFLDTDLAFPKDMYAGGPFLVHRRGWYYLSLVTQLPQLRYCTYLYRTKDFSTWEVGRYNPFMTVADEDRRVSPAAFPILGDKLRAEIPVRFVCSQSDVEMCDCDGRTYITYGIGDQMGFYYACEAWYDGPMDELLENFFK